MKVQIANEWYDLTDFDHYTDLLELGEVQDTDGLPDGITLTAKTFDALQEYAALSDDEQEIMLAYYEVTDVFDFEETQESYAGYYRSGAEFAQEFCEEVGYIPKALPDWIARHINWQDVWDRELHYDYFAHNDHYFRNL